MLWLGVCNLLASFDLVLSLTHLSALIENLLCFASKRGLLPTRWCLILIAARVTHTTLKQIRTLPIKHQKYGSCVVMQQLHCCLIFAVSPYKPLFYTILALHDNSSLLPIDLTADLLPSASPSRGYYSTSHSILAIKQQSITEATAWAIGSFQLVS